MYRVRWKDKNDQVVNKTENFLSYAKVKDEYYKVFFSGDRNISIIIFFFFFHMLICPSIHKIYDP